MESGRNVLEPAVDVLDSFLISCREKYSLLLLLRSVTDSTETLQSYTAGTRTFSITLGLVPIRTVLDILGWLVVAHFTGFAIVALAKSR